MELLHKRKGMPTARMLFTILFALVMTATVLSVFRGLSII